MHLNSKKLNSEWSTGKFTADKFKLPLPSPWFRSKEFCAFFSELTVPKETLSNKAVCLSPRWLIFPPFPHNSSSFREAIIWSKLNNRSLKIYWLTFWLRGESSNIQGTSLGSQSDRMRECIFIHLEKYRTNCSSKPVVYRFFYFYFSLQTCNFTRDFKDATFAEKKVLLKTLNNSEHK